MGLLETLRSGIKTADKVTKGLQATVQYQKATMTGQGPVHGPKQPLKAIVDYRSVQVRTMSGQLTVTRAVITLLDVEAVRLATNGEGIGNEDLFTLPDGDWGPILDISGFVDAGTGNPIPTTVMLG